MRVTPMNRACALLLSLSLLCAPFSVRAEEALLRPLPRPPGRTLLNAGVATFVSGYATAYIAGILLVSFDLEDRQKGGNGLYSGTRGNWGTSAGLLLIPVLGPVLSAATYREPGWAIPWAILDGGAQLAGLAMMIAGGSIEARARAKQGRWPQGLRLQPWGGAGLALSGRF